MAAKFSRTKNVRVDASSGTIAYTGGSSVGGAISSQAFSRRAPYFEFKIVDRGSSCAIGVGASPSDYSLDKMPGKAPQAPVVVPTPPPIVLPVSLMLRFLACRTNTTLMTPQAGSQSLSAFMLMMASCTLALALAASLVLSPQQATLWAVALTSSPTASTLPAMAPSLKLCPCLMAQPRCKHTTTDAATLRHATAVDTHSQSHVHARWLLVLVIGGARYPHVGLHSSGEKVEIIANPVSPMANRSTAGTCPP